MSSWHAFALDSPEFAAIAEAAFDAHLHHVLATVRADGSPRVSGTEVHVVSGQLWLGMMPGSAKLADVARDSRIALHAAPIDTALLVGDIKVSGNAMTADDPSPFLDFLRQHSGQEPPAGAMLIVDLTEVVRTAVNGDELLIETWRPSSGTSLARRR